MMIIEAVENKKWLLFRPCHNAPPIPHLLFADDLLLFGKATLQQATNMVDILARFCNLLGQTISSTKSIAFAGPKVGQAVKQQITDVTGIAFTNQPGRYLGLPFLSSGKDGNTYKYVLEKVQSRLAGWKSKHLTLACCYTLINSIISSIPTYVLQSAWLPQSTCEALNRLNRNFL